MATLCLAQEDEADELLSKDPLALLVGMVLDQQIPLERAFAAPRALRERLGTDLDAHALAAMDPEQLAAAFSAKPALHRFPSANARRVQQLCQILVDDYGGDAAQVWLSAPSGADLLARVRALPGFGDQKARIFVALLGKQLGVRPPGWEVAARPFAEAGTHMSVADITSSESLVAVRHYKAGLKAAAKAAATGAAPK